MTRPKRRFLLVAAMIIVGAVAPAADAGFVSVVPNSVNRIIKDRTLDGVPFADIHFEGFFSTHGFSTQKTLLETTNAVFEAALLAELGALGTGEFYKINSATLTIGTISDNYAPLGAAGVYRMLVAWDSDDVTWNEADADANILRASGIGGGPLTGTGYASTAIDNGTLVDLGGSTANDATVWSGLGATVQAWLDGTATNYGLFFADTGAARAREFTVAPGGANSACGCKVASFVPIKLIGQ